MEPQKEMNFQPLLSVNQATKIFEKLALQSVVRAIVVKDGARRLVFTSFFENHEDPENNSKVKRVHCSIDYGQDYWSQIADVAFAVNDLVKNLPEAKNGSEVQLKHFRGVVCQVDSPDQSHKIFVAGERGHQDMKSFQRMVRRMAAKLTKLVQ